MRMDLFNLNWRGIFTSKGFLYFVFLLFFSFSLSSHTFAYWPGDNWWLRCLYWFTYLSLSCLCLFGVYFLIKVSRLISNPHLQFLAAALVSWIPFGLAISMIDIATGRGTAHILSNIHNTGFSFSFLFSKIVTQMLLKHISLSSVFYLLHFHFHRGVGTDNIQLKEEATGNINFEETPFLSKLPKNLRTKPMRLNAQEHYMEIITKEASELILYKFGQAIRELPNDLGYQTHRSYWVAKDNIVGWIKIDGGIKLRLKHGSDTPVSRRFENQIKENFSEIKT